MYSEVIIRLVILIVNCFISWKSFKIIFIIYLCWFDYHLVGSKWIFIHLLYKIQNFIFDFNIQDCISSLLHFLNLSTLIYLRFNYLFILFLILISILQVTKLYLDLKGSSETFAAEENNLIININYPLLEIQVLSLTK